MSNAPSPPEPSTSPGDVVELRVHGVSGASGGEVLDRPHVQQVAGDRSAGFHRPRPGYPGAEGASSVALEAYRWSDLSAGTAARTLSLLFLLPFMLCNVAMWTHPAGNGAWLTAMKAVCRTLALTLTALYVLAIAGVTLDLIAWKCVGSSSCMAGRGWLSWLGGWPAGLRLAVLALVPAAAIGLVWWLGARPGKTFEAFRGPSAVSGAHQLNAVAQWDTSPSVGRLRAIHVAAAFATLDLVLLTARTRGGASASTIALTAVTAAVLVGCIALACAHPLIDQTARGRGVDWTTQALRTATCVLTPLVAIVVATDPRPWPPEAGLPGYGIMVASLLVAQTALLLLLWALVLSTRKRPGRGARGRDFGTPVLAAVAAGAAVAFSAELVYRVADLLSRDAPTTQSAATSPPLVYDWAIFGISLSVLAALVVAALVILLSRPGRRRAAAITVAHDFPHAPPEAAPRLRQVEKAIARARFTERLEPLASVYAWLAGLGLATSTLGLLELEPGDVIERWTRIPAGLVNSGIAVGSYVIAALILGLVVGGIFAYRTTGFRRYVGVLWDLGTFWPRSAHPFAPPCYAARAVPELARRISYLTSRGHAVLLTGHSHGSVLIAATVLQLPPDISERVALLTYGSPLRRLYARSFPDFVNNGVLREVGERVGWRWLNLWRETDPIGSWMFSPHRSGEPPSVAGPAGSVDRRLRDPWHVVPPSGSIPPPVIGHWAGESDPRFDDAVRELAGRLRHTLPPAD